MIASPGEIFWGGGDLKWKFVEVYDLNEVITLDVSQWVELDTTLIDIFFLNLSTLRHS